MNCRYRASIILTLMLGTLAKATAQSPLPSPQDLLGTPPDFRLKQTLMLEQLGPATPESGIPEVGLSWNAAPSALDLRGKNPDSVLKLSQRFRHVILADLAERRLYLLENGAEGLRILRHMYATIGKNGTRKRVQDDGRTPIGVYTVTRFLHDDALPELYGAGAFPLDYPNLWDQREQRTGYGIWVHGVPRDPFSRPPLSSEGCVAVGNEDLDSLKPFVNPGQTRVIFSDTLKWIDVAEQQSRAHSFQRTLEAWRLSWNSRNTEAFLAFYADDFSTPDMTREQFARNKHRVNAFKNYIEVTINDISIFDYPDEAQLRLVEFEQDYRSDTYAEVDYKRQFWRLDEDGRWRIVHESILSAPF